MRKNKIDRLIEGEVGWVKDLRKDMRSMVREVVAVKVTQAAQGVHIQEHGARLASLETAGSGITWQGLKDFFTEAPFVFHFAWSSLTVLGIVLAFLHKHL